MPTKTTKLDLLRAARAAVSSTAGIELVMGRGRPAPILAVPAGDGFVRLPVACSFSETMRASVDLPTRIGPSTAM